MPFLRLKRSLKRALYSIMVTSIETFLAILSLMASVPVLINPGKLAPSSVQHILPGWYIYPWALGLAIGGGLALLGILTAEFRVERSGVGLLGVTSGIYSLALASALPNSFVPFITYLMMALAMMARHWVLKTHIAMQNDYLHHILEAQDIVRRRAEEARDFVSRH